MTDFYSQNRCVCSTRSHGPLLCAFCLSFHFNNYIMENIMQFVFVCVSIVYTPENVSYQIPEFVHFQCIIV